MDNEQLTNRVPMSCARLDAVRALAPRTCEGGGTSAHTGAGGSTNFRKQIE